jgi:4-hydroxy-3-polyprenylbenzoate decarboxylase
MTHASLRDFIAFLERRGALVRVRAPVSPVLEMTEIGRRLIAGGGPATLFENIVGPETPYAAPWPRKVLANLFGTTQRVAWAMGRELDELRTLGESLAFLQHPDPPASLKEALAMLPKLRLALAKNPRTVSAAPCQQVVLRGADINLAKIPIQTCWPGEPAPLITFPLVVTKAPGAKPEEANLGIYRMQVIGRDRTLMRWLQHRGGAQHLAQHGESSSAPLPVAAVIGADPATTIAAVTPIPDKVSEYAFAGLLRGRRTRLADCVSVPLKVPAEAEMVIEGHVSLSESGD